MTSHKRTLALRPVAVLIAPVLWSERRGNAALRMRADFFARPWSWLGLTSERWRRTPFSQRVQLF